MYFSVVVGFFFSRAPFAFFAKRERANDAGGASRGAVPGVPRGADADGPARAVVSRVRPHGVRGVPPALQRQQQQQRQPRRVSALPRRHRRAPVPQHPAGRAHRGPRCCSSPRPLSSASSSACARVCVCPKAHASASTTARARAFAKDCSRVCGTACSVVCGTACAGADPEAGGGAEDDRECAGDAAAAAAVAAAAGRDVPAAAEHAERDGPQDPRAAAPHAPQRAGRVSAEERGLRRAPPTRVERQDPTEGVSD